MDANNNPGRLHLNFANERLQLPNDRAYPTTPSTFPQPVFPPPGSAQPPTGGAPQQPAYGAAGGYAQAPQGYFAQPGYSAQQQQQQQPQQYGGQAAGYDYNNAGGAAYQGARPNGPGTADPNTGLAHQFSHQNLGGAARAAQYGARGPAPPRPRTAGNSGQPSPYGGYNNVPLPTQTPQSEFQAIPERNPDKYGSNANSNQKKCSQLAADFFKDSVKRARERNQR